MSTPSNASHPPSAPPPPPHPSLDPSLPTSPSRPPAPSPNTYERATHALSLTLLLAAPLIIALPPRKLDLYTFSLAGSWLVSANHLTAERTGLGIMGNVNRRIGSNFGVGVGVGAAAAGSGLPTQKARDVQAHFQAERAMREQEKARRLGADGTVRASSSSSLLSSSSSVSQHQQHHHDERQEQRTSKDEDEDEEEAAAAAAHTPTGTGVVGLTQKLWRGSEPADWKTRRLQEEREALEEGKGYWDLIGGQIWEVWNWGRKDEDGYGYGARHAREVEEEKARVEALKREKGRGGRGEE